MAAADQALQGEIRTTAQHQERGRGARRLRLRGFRGCDDPVQLPRVSARELDADDVRVGRELDDDVGGEIHAGHRAGVVVDDERDGGLVCDGSEELDDAGGRGGEERRIVRGWEDEGIIASSCVRFTAVLDRFPHGLRAAADEDGEVGESGSSECRAGGRGHGLAFRVSEVYCFAV